METTPVSDLVRTVTALVPMRHYSERVPGKNYRLMAGRPLYAYILETLLCCRSVLQASMCIRVCCHSATSVSQPQNSWSSSCGLNRSIERLGQRQVPAKGA